MWHLNQWTVVLAFMVMIIGFCSPAQALDDNGANRLAEIVVSSKPLTGVEASGSEHRITEEQIKRQGADTLKETLSISIKIIRNCYSKALRLRSRRMPLKTPCCA